MTAEQAPARDGASVMTLRVSRVRDGRVVEQGDEVRITAGDPLEPLITFAWPPCRCPLHRAP